MYKIKGALIILIVAAICMQQTESKALLAKIKVLKAPLIAAKIGVAAGVGAKIKLAAFKKWEATKAKGAAVKSIIAAPFKIAKAATILKIGAIKSAAALKIAAAKGLFHVKHKKIAAVVAAKPNVIVPVPVPQIQNIIPSVSQYTSSYIKQLENIPTIIDARSNQGSYQLAIPYVPFEDNSVQRAQFGTIQVVEPHLTYGVPNV